MTTFQLYGALPAPIESALRASIKLHGVLVPVAVDQNGHVLDGHHRQRIAEEEGVECPTTIIQVDDDADADEIARTLNADRRQLDESERKKAVSELRANGHSVRAIAGALGVSKSTVHNDLGELSSVGQLTEPDRVTGADGKSRPASNRPAKAQKKKSAAKKQPDPEADAHAPNLADELERADKQIREQQELIESLKKDDLAKEVAKWKKQFDQLNGRVQQFATTTAEAKKTAQYQADLLAKIRKALKVNKNSEILPALKR